LDIVLNNLVAWAFTTGKIFFKSDGTPWRPIMHIEDISRAFIATLEAPEDRVFNQAPTVSVRLRTTIASAILPVLSPRSYPIVGLSLQRMQARTSGHTG